MCQDNLFDKHSQWQFKYHNALHFDMVLIKNILKTKLYEQDCYNNELVENISYVFGTK